MIRICRRSCENSKITLFGKQNYWGRGTLIGLSFTFFLSILGGCSSSSKPDPEDAVLVDQMKAGDEYQSKNTDLKIPSFNVEKYVLPNGLKVLLSENPNHPIFSLYMFVDVGSKDEKKGITGASHFLEHMMFEGTKKFKKGEFSKMIEDAGGSTNAYTTYDNTVYYEHMPIESLDRIIEAEADRMQNLLLDPKEFLREKQVVLEERKMRYENSPQGQMRLLAMSHTFKGTPYETPVIGSVADIKSVTRDQVYDYFKKYYAPNNAVMVIVGDIKANRTIKKVISEFGAIPASKAIKGLEKDREAKEKKSEKAKKGENNYQLRKRLSKVDAYYGQAKNPLFYLGFKGVKYGEPIGFKGDVLSSLLTDSDSSYLIQKLVKGKNPLLSSIYSHNYTLKNAGTFYFAGEILPGVSIARVRKRLLDSLRSFCAKDLTDQMVDRTKNHTLLDFYHGLQTNSGMGRFLGTMEVYAGDFKKYRDELETYLSIKKPDIKRACDKFLDFKDYYFLTVWDQHKRKPNLD